MKIGGYINICDLFTIYLKNYIGLLVKDIIYIKYYFRHIGYNIFIKHY